MELDKVFKPIQSGEQVMVVAPLSNAFFEKEVLEWKELATANNYKIIYSEIKKDLEIFTNIEEAKTWLESQSSPHDEELAYFLSNQPSETDKKIFIPYRRLILILEG